MIRVLVAEDSATARALLVQVLSADPEIEVVGQARDGVEAVRMTQNLRPDVVTMDIHMPRLDGLSATKEIMITAPTPIVIVTGSSRVRDVQDSLDILSVGALDVLFKLPAPNSSDFAMCSRRLVDTVKAMSHVKVVRHWRSAAAKPEPPRPSTHAAVRARVVAVAASTGGPAALQSLFSGLSASFPAPIVVVQHITVGFTTGLASWLSTVCPLKVKVAERGEALAPRTIYLAPDDRHLGLTATGTVAISDAPAVGGFRPSGSFLFESVARAYGASAVGVILTGMGDDGVSGLRELHRAGGRVIAQDEKTSIVFGMPGSAVAAGVADVVLPLDAIAAHLLTLV